MSIEKTRYSDEELNEFKELIENKLQKAHDKVAFYKDQLSDKSDNADSKARGLDDGIGTAEKERLTTLAAREEKYIKHLKNALIRIENKAYGICRQTGKLIKKERLRAVPHATLSMEAKSARR